MQICSFYPRSYPPPPNRLWGFFLKRGEGTPGSSEHRTVKSQNLTWVFPLRAERPTPSFYKTIERLRRLCQKSICFKKEKSARELSSPVPSGEFASEFWNGANLSLGSAGQQPPGGHRPSPQGAPLPSRPLFLPSTPIRYLLQVGCLGAEKGLLARHSWGRIPGRGVSLQRFSGGSQRREASRGSLGSNVLFTIKIYFTIYLFFFFEDRRGIFIASVRKCFQTRIRASGHTNVPSRVCLVCASAALGNEQPPTRATLGKRVLPARSSGVRCLGRRGCFS